MMSKARLLSSVVLALGVAASAQAQTPASADPAGGLIVNLMDGSIITGSLGVKEISIDTEFGKLSVPVTRIQSLTPGLDSHTDFQKKVTDLIEKLGAAEAPARDSAQKELIRIGPTLRGELTRRANDPDPERKLRIAAILEEFNQATEGDDAEAAAPNSILRLDAIETPDFTIVGRIVPKSFEVASPYGALSVKLGDIRRVARPNTGQKEEIAKTISVDGTNVVQMRFKETGLKVERGDKITVKADGQLTMTPWGSEAQSTPDGAPNYGWYINNQIAMGALVAKIGKSGTVIKVGSNASFTADQAGELQFAIAMRQGYEGNAFPGKYNVKVRVRPKSTSNQ